MTGFGWQDAIALVLALVAAGWLGGRRLRASRRPTPLCGDCPGCTPAPSPTAGDGALIPMSELTRRDA